MAFVTFYICSHPSLNFGVKISDYRAKGPWDSVGWRVRAERGFRQKWEGRITCPHTPPAPRNLAVDMWKWWFLEWRSPFLRSPFSGAELCRPWVEVQWRLLLLLHFGPGIHQPAKISLKPAPCSSPGPGRLFCGTFLTLDVQLQSSARRRFSLDLASLAWTESRPPLHTRALQNWGLHCGLDFPF